MQKGTGKVTIKDIAKITNLSPATVSLVLNHKPHRLSEETRKRVLEVAEELHYRPNNSAVSLKTKKSTLIGMVVSDFTNAFFGEMAKGAERRCAKDGYALLVSSTSSKAAINYDYINILIDKGVEGMIISFYGIESSEICQLIDYLHGYGIRIVFVGHCISYGGVKNITLDDEMGGYLATRHLLDLGHRRIGCITGPLTENCNPANQRLSGYKRALSEAGLSCPDSFVIEGDYSIQSGYTSASAFHEQGITAITAANDMCAYGIYKWAKEHHLSIPEKLSVVGYDDIIFSDFFSPELTTIHQPACHMGYEAADYLIQGMENTDCTVIKPQLILRESTRSILPAL